MDLSLKQRLLGAAVLIALAVIFIPMFISGSAPQKSAEIETRNLAIPPAPDREFQQRVLPLEPASTPQATPSPPATEALATVDTGNAPPSPTPVPAPPSEPTPDPVTTGQAGPATPTPPATTPADANPEPVAGQAANGRYLVHLGVYADGTNARDLVATLAKAGYPAFAESTRYEDKPAERVRVGPFADRAAAEAVRLRIKRLKPALPGSVVQVAADAAQDAPASALPATRAGGWAVQLGAFKAEADAGKIRERLKNAGFAAFVDKVDANGTTLWRVRAGPEVDRGAADRLRAGIRDKLKIDGIIVVVP